MANLALRTAQTPATTEADLKELGRQLTQQYERAELSALEIVAFGAMMLQFEAAIAAFDSNWNQKPAGSGRYRSGSGLKAAVARYAPEVKYKKAWQITRIARALQAELSLKSPEELRLVASPQETPKLVSKLAKKRDQLIKVVNDQSLHGLEVRLDILDESTSRSAPAKKLTPAERRAAWIEAARANALDAFNSVHCLEERWKLLTDDQLALAQKNAAKLAKEIERWLATAPAKRAALHVEKYLGEEATP